MTKHIEDQPETSSGDTGTVAGTVVNTANKPHPEVDDVPKFGRLLIVLVIAVVMMALLTFASIAYYS